MLERPMLEGMPPGTWLQTVLPASVTVDDIVRCFTEAGIVLTPARISQSPNDDGNLFTMISISRGSTLSLVLRALNGNNLGGKQLALAERDRRPEPRRRGKPRAFDSSWPPRDAREYKD